MENESPVSESPLLRYFPLVLVNQIIDFCDLGDCDDGGTFSSHPESRERWLSMFGFLDETLKSKGRYYRQTTILLGDKRVFHSFDDKPCLTIATKPGLEFNPTVNTENQYISCRGGEDDPLVLAVWARFGVVHRNCDFAVLQVWEGGRARYRRFWVTNGMTRDPQIGFAHKYIYCSYPSHGQNHTLWMKQQRVAFATPLEWENDKRRRTILSLPAEMIPHREDGAAIENFCMDDKESKEQILEAKDGEYNDVVGPFPYQQFYLNGHSLSSKEWAEIIAASEGGHFDLLELDQETVTALTEG